MRGRVSWVYAILPVSLATGPIGSLIQLYLLELNGNALGTIYAGLAATVFSGITIPASIFWGYTTDRLHQRKGTIVASYIVMATVFLSFYGQDTVGIIAEYAVFSFISAASATPLNLLIMESEDKSKWASKFATLSMVSGIGNTAGSLLSAVWVQTFPIILIMIPLAMFSLVSAALSVLLIREPPISLEDETIVMRGPSFFSRLLSLPMMFLNVPKPRDFIRVFRGLRYGMTSYIPLLYISIVLFYLSSGLFNASFVSGLHLFAISDGVVLGVIFVGQAVQTVTFQFAGRYLSNKSLVSAAGQSLVLRAASYIFLGVFAFFLGQPLYVVPALILWPLASGVAFGLYYTASNTLIFNSVQKRNPGSTLGVYSAIVGMATLVGSLPSGFISVYLGFHVTFLAAGLLMLFAAFLTFGLRRFEHAGKSGVPT